MADAAASAPLLSVILPTFNGTVDQIDRCARSISEQSFADFECLVLDDSTSDASRSAWDAWSRRDGRFRIIRQPARLGFVRSLNAGIAIARGTYVARCDTDDVNLPSRFERQIAEFESRNDLDVVGSSTIVDRGDGSAQFVRRYPPEHATIWQATRLTSGVAHPTVVFRRESFARFGTYDESFRYAEDVELCLRWMAQGAVFANVPEPLVILYIPEDGRPASHWRYAFRARLRHSNLSSLMPSIAGLLVSGGASLLPTRLARLGYRVARHRGKPLVAVEASGDDA